MPPPKRATPDPNRIRVKRIYDEAEPEDGHRVLVDRIWPRGFSKQRAKVDDWMKEAGPSNELRQWFGHTPERWPEFRVRYRKELRSRGESVEALIALAKAGTLTLVFSARDEERNQAVVLQEFLLGKL